VDAAVEMSAATTLLGDITAAAAGTIRAVDVDGINLDIDISGASLADLKRLAPLNLPETVPHRKRVPAKLRRRSRSNRFSRSTLPARFFHKRFAVEDWPIMDADVRFEGKSILDAAQVPIEYLSAHWMLDDGVLRFEPLRFRMVDGEVTANINVDIKHKPPLAKANIQVSGLNLTDLFPTILARGAAAVALAVVNPLLAIVPFIETGLGEDSDFGELLRRVKSPGAKTASDQEQLNK
jgi:hypothetical protein